MADMRLVDANALDKKIGELYTTVHYAGKTDDPQIDHRINLTDYLKGYENGIIAALRVMRSAEKVDAVPVVRCKECRYVTAEDGEFYCDGPIGIFGTVGFNDFCSFGERKDDGLH